MTVRIRQGQICAAATRILVERPVHEEFVAGLGAAAAGVRIGDPDAPDIDMGPLINRAQLDRVLGYIAVDTIIPFDDEEQAVALVNDSIYGLTATVWTSNVSRAHRVAGQVRAGQVWVHGWGAFHPGLPWGGFK